MSGSSSLDKLLAADPKLSRTEPLWTDHSELAIATGNLARLPADELAATSTLKKVGFKQEEPGFWVHEDQSWVRFFDGNVFRGNNDEVFTSLVIGPGPQVKP